MADQQTSTPNFDLSFSLPRFTRSQVGSSINVLMLSKSTVESLRYSLTMDKNDNRFDDLLKNGRLDPAPIIQDNSIGDYYTRVKAILPQDRDEVRFIFFI
jgi:hypothetical protein